MITMGIKREKRAALSRSNGSVLPVKITSMGLYEPAAKIPKPKSTLLIYRAKRKVTQEKKDLCKGLAIGSRILGGIGNIAGEVSDGAGFLLGPGGKAAAVAVQLVLEEITIVTDVVSLAMDCDDIPFEELKDFMEEQFNEVDKALDRNFELLQEVAKIASQTLLTIEAVRTEMHKGFDLILDSLKELGIGPIVAKMNSFIKDFNDEKRLIDKISRDEYIERIEIINDALEKLFLQRKTADATMNEIMQRTFANPKDSTDVHEFSALNALYYGIQTYYSLLFFLIQQHSRIASYYYEIGDLDKYNEHFVKISDIFDQFKTALLGQNALTSKVVDRLEAAESSKLISNEQRKELLVKIKELKRIKDKLVNMNLPYITAQPTTLPHDPIKNRKIFNIPIRDKKRNTNVVYAIQYQNGKQYSKIGDWSAPITLKETTIATLRIPVGQEGRTRIIFRKFDNEKPEIVGVIEDASQYEFQDINRDLYNAALKKKFDRFDTLLKSGADPKVAFDQGRTAVHAAAEGGSKKILNKVMDIDRNEINRRDSKGYTPLHVASEAGYDDFLKVLIRHGADVNAKTDYYEVTPLHLAVKEGYLHTVEALLKFEKIDVNLGDRSGFTPLHNAASSSAGIVKALVKHKHIDVNATSKTSMTPLHLAASNNFYDAAEALLNDTRIDVDLQSEAKLTALHYAVSAGSVEIVKLLKAHNANVNAKEGNNLTPLHYAVSLKKIDVALELLNGPIDVNSKDNENVTPLHIAVSTGKKDIVKKLLKKGADVNVATKDGLTPLHMATMKRREQMVRILTNSNAQIEARTNNGTTPLLAACQKEAFSIVKYLVEERGADIMAKDNSGNDILQMSIKNGDLDMVKYIINHKRFTQDLSSVLKLALPYGSLNIVEYLVEEKNVDASCTDLNNYCPLSEACKYNFLPVVEYLLKKTRNVALSGKPFQNALQYGHLDIVKYFIEKKDVPDDTKDEYLQTPLQIATKNGWYDIVKYLVEVRHKPTNIKYDKERTLLHFAAASGNLVLIKYLIEDRKIDPHNTDANGNTVLHYAINGIKENNLDEEKITPNLKYLIIKERVNIDARNSNKETPLHRAVFYDLINVAELLVSLGANVPLYFGREFKAVSTKMKEFLEMQSACNGIIHPGAFNLEKEYVFVLIQNDYNVNAQCLDTRQPAIYHTTALHLAVSTRFMELANNLIEWNADVNVRDEQGNTPLYFAVAKGNVDLVKKLLKYGADMTIKNLNDDNPILLAERDNLEGMLEVLNLEQFKTKLWSAANENGITNLKQFDKLKGDLCEEDKNGNTLMHLAASNGHINIVNYLIGKNCPINSVNKDGKTPLYLATLNRHVDIIQALLDSGADITTTRYSAEDFIYYSDDITITKISWNGSEDPSIVAKLICRNVKYDNFDIVKFFVDGRNSSAYYLSDGDNMQYHLFKSIREGTLESIQLLVEQDTVDVNYLYHGLPPIADACLVGRLDVVKYLIQRGSDFGIKSVFGCTSLHWAAFGGHLDIVKYLAQKNQSDLKAVDAGGRTPLHYSVMYAKSNIVKYLINTQRLDVNVKDNNGNTVVHLATQWNNEDTLTYLLNEKGVSLKAKNKQGSTPLHVAAANGNLKIVEILLKKGANIEETDNKGRTPLFIATENGYMELITYFLDNGARLDTRDKDGLTLNDIAGKMGHLDVESFMTEQLKPSNESQFASNYLKENCREIPSRLLLMKRSTDNQTSVNLRATACLQNNLSLGLLVLQNYFDKNFPLPKFTQITPEIARATSLEIIDGLEKVIQKSTPNADEVLDKLDFYQLYLDIGANIKNETFSEIPKILLKFINSGCSDDNQVLNKIIGEIGKMFPKFKNH